MKIRRLVAIPFVVGAIFPHVITAARAHVGARRNPLCCRGYFPSEVVRSDNVLDLFVAIPFVVGAIFPEVQP